MCEMDVGCEFTNKQITNEGSMLYQNGWLRFLRLRIDCMNGAMVRWWLYGMARIESIWLWY